MLPAFLVPEQIITKNGQGEALALGDASGSLVQLTLGLTEVVEQESFELAVHGSRDGTEWDAVPLLLAPQKFYRGTTAFVLDLARYPDLAFLQARWKVNRWGRGSLEPRFGVYVFAQPVAL